ncbi:MAG: PRC-barrel domain-containing protein [Phycisphaerae bacterium]|nr:PRC-barrel domain-containing protein [Phycisphaerae bacterium]
MNLSTATAASTYRQFFGTALVVGSIVGAVAAAPLLQERGGPIRDQDGQRDNAPGTDGATIRTRDDRTIGKADAMGQSADAKRTAEMMRQNGTTLQKAIDAAERQFNGQAVEARCRKGGDGGSSVIDITVVDKEGKVMVAAVDLGTGKVVATRGYSDDGTYLRDSRDVREPRDPKNPHDADRAYGIAKASECIGKDIYDGTNRKVGEIEEIAIDDARGRVAYVIVDLDGNVDRLVAVPWNSFRHHSKPDRLDLDGGRTLESAPSFQWNSWPNMHTEEFGRPIADYYHTDLYGKDVEVPKGTAMNMIKLTEVLGMNIKSPSGEALGEIEDVVVDPSTGKVSYAVLSFGGFMGFNDKLFAVPWTSLTARKDGSVVFPVTKDRLKNAPGFDKSNWPTTANQTFNSEVENYYRNRTASVNE